MVSLLTTGGLLERLSLAVDLDLFRPALKRALQLLSGATLATLLSFSSPAVAGAVGEMRSAYQLGKEIWADLRGLGKQSTSRPPGLHLFASLSTTRTLRSNSGRAIHCASDRVCTWAVLFYHVENRCDRPINFRPRKLQIEWLDAQRNEISMSNVAAFKEVLGEYPTIYVWQNGVLGLLAEGPPRFTLQAETPAMSEIWLGGWVAPGGSVSAYNLYAALGTDGVGLWQMKYREDLKPDPAYGRREEWHIGGCPLQFHPQF